MSAINEQVGGSHYKDLRIQPMELAYRFNGSPVFLAVSKYLTREKGKRKEDFQKALHCVQLERVLRSGSSLYGIQLVNGDLQSVGNDEYMREFCDQFWQGNRIFVALDSLHRGRYARAESIINELIEILE